MNTDMILRREVTVPKPDRRTIMARLVLAIGLCGSIFGVVTSTAASIDAHAIAVHRIRLSSAAQAMVDDYAARAYPAWRRDHSERSCPESLFELNQYSSRSRVDEITDPWGNDVQMSCNDDRIRVWSIGRDRNPNTFDDVRSWE